MCDGGGDGAGVESSDVLEGVVGTCVVLNLKVVDGADEVEALLDALEELVGFPVALCVL